MHLKLVKDVKSLKQQEEEGRAYIRSIMKAWAKEYELNEKGEIVKKKTNLIQMGIHNRWNSGIRYTPLIQCNGKNSLNDNTNVIG